MLALLTALTEIEVVIMDHIGIEKDMIDNDTEILTSVTKIHLTSGHTGKESKAGKHGIKKPRTDVDLLLVSMAQSMEFFIGDAL